MSGEVVTQIVSQASDSDDACLRASASQQHLMAVCSLMDDEY